MPLEILLDLDIVDSKVEAAFFAQKSRKDRKRIFIDQLQF